MVIKSTRFRSLWHTLTMVCHRIGKRSAYVYAQGKVWLAKRQLGGATRHAGQWIMASWHATSWHALPLQHKVLLLGLGALILLLAIWKVPQWQAASWQGRIEPKDVAKLENDARTTLVQAVGGLALLIGLLFTWRNVKATERTSQETLRISQEGQLTERFTRAIDQLGSDKLQICLGGIYALERIARDSERDRWPIMEVLTAYVRVKAPWKAEAMENHQPPPKPAADIQAILTVLGRRTRTFRQGESEELNLGDTDLRGATLTGAQLQGAILINAQLQRADLTGAQLQRAHLSFAELEGANLPNAQLQGADLAGAQLQGAILINAQLQKANLTGAQLEGANLSFAQLEGVEGLTVEQLSTVKTLYQARLDPPLQEQIQQQSS
jgi:hypothetical protein